MKKLILTLILAICMPLITSTHYSFAQAQKDRQAQLNQIANMLASKKGGAPDFNLQNLNGQYVKLSDYRGKWVVIDFWASWCGWCIKGFPELKKVYNQNKSKLEVIGVDCYDSESDWRNAVEEYKLPWVNVYNPENSSVCSDYNVTAFPTKVIINPKGKIVDVTEGEDPEFYDKLAKFINGQ